jgi:ComF family protein
MLAAPGALGGFPVLAGGAYEGALARAIQRLKYESRPDLARPLAALLVERCGSVLRQQNAALVPVPLHFSRLVERGFNQSALIARELARATGLCARPRLLLRVRDTGRQAELDREARARNVEAAFRVSGGPLPRAAFVVDDVVTTGATARACATVLEAAGVNVLGLCALARTGH